MKSVAYVTTTFPTMAAFIENEVHRLVARGVRVRVLTLRGVSRVHQPEHAALVPLTRAIGSPLAPAAWGAFAAWTLRRPAVMIGGTLEILWASRGSLYALAGHLGYLPAAARVASVIEREDLEIVHGAWAHFPATVAWLAARLAGRPFTMAAHAGSDVHRTRAFLARKAHDARFTAACVRGNADLVRSLGGPGARVEWLYHGVDTRRFDGRGRARAARASLLCVGRLSPPKGFDLAVRATGLLAARGHDVQLTIVGDGPERHALEALAREAGAADRVTFRGELTHDQLLPLYRDVWALLAPCRVLANGRQDGIPNVVVEAMAMCVPCIGTRAAGLEEAILPGRTGALCAPEDAEALAGAIEPLLRDPGELDRFGAEARAIVLEQFDADRNFERLHALFESASATPAEREPGVRRAAGA